MYYKDTLYAVVESNEHFVSQLRIFLRDHKLTISKFCKQASIPESTLYKIISDPSKDFRITTLRDIIKTMKKIEGYESEGTTIAIITSRDALDIIRRTMIINDKKISIREYPANSIEEEIIQGVHAERSGVKGIVCGPVAASTLEKVVNIPVIGLPFEETLIVKALEKISRKL